MNRAKESSICSAVYAKNQFSWTNKHYKVTDKEAWQNALKIASNTLAGITPMLDFKATHFHNSSVKPKWAKKAKKVAKIGSHTFYVL
jgi:spore germination cell wall hydrolase CwlJ-like protein